MALSTHEIGIIVASCVGGLLGVACIIMVIARDRNRFAFSSSRPVIPPTDIEAQIYDKPGKLQINGKKKTVEMGHISRSSLEPSLTQSSIRRGRVVKSCYL